jgi:hypothetical protein
MRVGSSQRMRQITGFTTSSVLWLMLLSHSNAALTNLAIGNSGFEGTGTGIIDDAAFESSYPQWSTADNEFEILAQGADSAPINNSLGSPTGQSLEILGTLSGGQISLIIDIPSNVIAGSLAQLSFQAWSLDDGTNDYYNSGRLRIDDGPGPQPWVNNGPQTNINTTLSAWTLNTRSFQVDPGDTIYIQWKDGINRTANYGLRIDDVQVLVNIVPEPGLIGVILLGLIMVSGYLRKRKIA